MWSLSELCPAAGGVYARKSTTRHLADADADGACVPTRCRSSHWRTHS